MERWIVDRIEDRSIILEKDNDIICIKAENIDFDVKEGDILTKNKEGRFILDGKAKLDRDRYIKKLVENLWEN